MTMDGSPPASGSFPQMASASLVGEVLDGRYRLVRKLGEGGMGEVYAADHVHIEKKFAVKLLRQEIVSNKEAVTRFRQEARSASSIGHRNIIAIEDFGQLPDGRIYMCMELLNGAPLNELIKQPLPVDRLLNILIQTGHGLAAAHAKGIIHRDMKPENVFVTWTPGGEDIPKLLDFGIAKVAGNEGQNNLTRTGTIFGTPYYMAPEQALGTHVDHRTDIYAMGVIMYEVFAGSLPFQGESFMGILTQHITTDPEPVVQRAAKAGRVLPPGIAEIVHRCMQKDPAHRFQSMDDLVAALVVIYRSVAGAGMSSYMEAFPQQSSSHINPSVTPNHFTPPPLTGPVVIGPGQSGPGGPPPPYQPSGPGGPPPPYQPSGQLPANQPARPSGGHPGFGYDPAGSVTFEPKKSKVGLIFAIIAVLAVVGGAVAFIIIGTSKKPTIAGQPDAAVAAAKVDAGVPPPDAAEVHPAAVDAGASPADAAIETPDAAEEPEIDAGASPSVQWVDVAISVTPSEARLYDRRNRPISGTHVKVNPRRAEKITAKAPGYKSKTITLNGRDEHVSLTLEKEEAAPPKPDCHDRLIDASSKSCLAQYCQSHGSAMECTE
jgi:serine/threonine protein kinase